MKKLVILTGAGISAESGLKTFRDADGLWEGHKVTDVATPEAWNINPQLVLDFYNQRRRQLLEAKPNAAHKLLAQLEKWYDVHIITQNVDDLHERGGSTKVMHLHGELFKVRSVMHPNLIYEWKQDVLITDKCEKGFALRPHIVWFGEDVPLMRKAAEIASQADYFVIIGTSMQVYPAAGLVGFAPENAPIIYIDPKPAKNIEIAKTSNLHIIAKQATEGCQEIFNMFISKLN